MRNVLFLSIFLCLSGAPAFAGPGSSGGGNAVVCFSDPSIPVQIRDPKTPLYGTLTDEMIQKVTSVETLDLYEAKQLTGNHADQLPDLVPMAENESVDTYIWDKIERRFYISSPAISSIMTESLRDFQGRNTIWDAHGLAQIQDTEMVEEIDSTHCVIATMAAQYKLGDGSYRLHIDQRLFNHPNHSKMSQATLFIHEYVYRYFRDKGAADSRATRDLVGLLLINHNLTQGQVYRELVSLGVDSYPGHELNRAKSAAELAIRIFADLTAEVVEVDQAQFIPSYIKRASRFGINCKTLWACLSEIYLQETQGSISRALSEFKTEGMSIALKTKENKLALAYQERWFDMYDQICNGNSLNECAGLTREQWMLLIKLNDPKLSNPPAFEYLMNYGRFMPNMISELLLLTPLEEAYVKSF